jgi:peptide/nickel transport system permease protein
MKDTALSIARLHRIPRWRPSSIRGAIGVGMLATITLAVLAAPLLAPHDPLDQDLANRLHPPLWAGGTLQHPLGTDQLGRDVLTRLLYGGQVSLLVGTTAAVGAGLLGTVLGLASGFVGGRLDTWIQNLAYAQLALPFVLLGIALVAALGPSLPVVVAVLVISNWVIFDRVLRASVFSIKERPFIEAAHMVGLSPLTVLLRHIVPHVVGILLVLLTIQIGRMILLESALSFLGLGVQPPQPTWGGIINEARAYGRTAPYLAVMPGIAIVITVLSISAAAGWIREVMDPRLAGIPKPLNARPDPLTSDANRE